MRALALLLLAGCTTARSATTDSISAVRVDSAVTTAARTEVTRTGGAVDSVTVTEEYLPVTPEPLPALPPDGGPAPSVASPPVLVRRTTTTTHVAPVEARATTDASSLTETHAQATAAATTVEQRSTRLGPPPWVWAFVPVALLALLLVAWRLRWIP